MRETMEALKPANLVLLLVLLGVAVLGKAALFGISHEEIAITLNSAFMYLVGWASRSYAD
jgi:hypothetical protein